MDDVAREDELRPIARPRHTLYLVLIIFAFAAIGAVRAEKVAEAPPHSRVPQYIVLFLAEWGLFYYATVGPRRMGVTLSEIFGVRGWFFGRTESSEASEPQARGRAGPAKLLGTLLLAGAFWIVAGVILAGVKRATDMLGGTTAAEAQRTSRLLVPHGPIEVLLWVPLSISAGICEEFVFRGYLQRQLGALTRNPVAGLLLSAIVFGVAHGYQGVSSVVVITVYGVLFGLLARLSRSLVPGIIVHAWQDLASGLFRM
jgi:membrane protease YdiL (CAAX protease family)